MKENTKTRIFAAMLCGAMILLAGCGHRTAGETEKEAPKAPAQEEVSATTALNPDTLLLVQEVHEGVSGDYTVDYTYDAEGKLIRKVAWGDQVTDYTYHANGKVKEEVLRIHDDRFGGNIRYSRTYRQDGTLEKTVDCAYGSNGKQTGEQTILYDSHGSPASETWFVYNEVAGSDKTIGKELYTLTYENTYDDEGRLTNRFQTRTDSSDMVEESWWYGVNGETTCRQDFITAGRLSHRETTVTNADGKVLTYLWESTDSYPAHRAEHNLYDDHGNLIYREYSENDIGGAHMGTISGSTTHYTNVYGKDGLLNQTMESAVSYYYDGLEMTTSTVPGHTAVSYTYDGQGRLLCARHLDVHGNELYEETWEYDAEGNLIRHADPSSDVITYAYAPFSTLKTN